ncbi:LysR family transcriptional regulator [Roseibium sp. SCP14]|uniref:LysR family transcriptional regulator n=1 Tax=Roseibium sp. SCP14 TaxID=3141375 RepID=UPI00333B2B7D
MRYRQIEAFRYVMVTGTTIGAADTMAITQPAVSRLIADLEAGLKLKLFDRVRGRLLPTPEAIRFYQGVEKFFTGIDQLEHVAEQIRTEQPAELKLCATQALSTFFFPPAIKRFRESYPSVDLVVESYSSSEIVSRLQTYLTHLGITPAFPEVPGIVQEHLLEQPHVCAVHESHPLAKKDVVTAEDFVGERMLSILPTGLVNWNRLTKVLEGAGVDYKGSIGIQNSHTGYSLVAENLAVALIEPFAAPTWRNNGVVTRPFEPKVAFEYVIAYSSSQRPPTPLKTFVEIVRKISRDAQVKTD